uniref:RNase H family protein n=1 Tax=Solanum tuberosum TaxID=4113 RepID=M1DMV9_SOLTU
MDSYKLITTVFPHIKWPSKWNDLIKLVERCVHETKVTIVYWKKTPDQWIKLNTDGSALSNPGRIGVGGILRDQKGHMKLAFATPLGEGTNNQVELETTIFGMTWSIHLGYMKVILEVDSQLLVDWIMLKAKPPWSISTKVQQHHELINQTNNFNCKYTFREANFVADSLSKHSHNITTPQLYFSEQQLPKETRAYHQMDIMEMANFRRRKIKKIKEPL